MLSSMYIVEQDEAFFSVIKSPRDDELASCICDRFRTIPFLNEAFELKCEGVLVLFINSEIKPSKWVKCKKIISKL